MIHILPPPTSHNSVHRIRAVLVALGFLGLYVSIPLHGQQRDANAAGMLVGTVVDAQTGAAVPAAEILVRTPGNSLVMTSGLSDRAGRFALTGIVPGQYEIAIRRLGYRAETQTVLIEGPGDAADMGVVRIAPSAVELTEVNVVAERPAVVYAPDRDIYSADAIAGAAGGSATDVLQGIPDLEVGIDGEVSLLGEAPAIYINGREAPMRGESLALFLEQFPAENIQDIEVMPNPSARYNAEGAGGIVNIVLKEGVELGVSGNAFVNGGTRGQLGTGGRATFQRGPLTLNGGSSLRLSTDERSSTELRQNLLVDPITFLGQNGYSDRSSWSGNLDLGAEYEFGSSTVLDGDLRLDRNISELERVTRYTEMDAERTITEEYDLISHDDGSGTSVDFALELGHRFAGESSGPSGRTRDGWSRNDELEIEFEYERGTNGEDRVIRRELLEDLGQIDYATELTWEEDRETESEVAIGFDLARSISEETAFEVGYEAEFGWTDESRLEERRLEDPSADPISRELRGFVHRQNVHGGYLTVTRSLGDLGAQVGVRAEHAGNWLRLPGEQDEYGRNYFSLYPNANINYTIDGSKRLRFSYSMRTRRPSSSILNPIDTSSDPLNRRVGNPDIEPQYTHSYMLNASWSGEIGSLRASPFLRRSVNQWEQIRTVDENGVSTTTYENLGSTNSYGMSITGTIDDVHGIRTRLSLNGQRTDRNYTSDVARPMPTSLRWSVRGNFDGRISEAFSAQGFLVYNPPQDLPQGKRSSTLMTRIGTRYRFLDGKASVNVNITDPFDIYDSSIQRSSTGFIETGVERVSMRRLTMSLSYSFRAGGGAVGGGGPRGRR